MPARKPKKDQSVTTAAPSEPPADVGNATTSAPAVSSVRVFVYEDDKSHKFWKIELKGKSFTTTYGKVGTVGQTQTKEFYSEAKAQKEHDKAVEEKIKKGYKETAAGGDNSSTTEETVPVPATAPEPTSPVVGMPIVYDKVTICEFSSTSQHGPLTPDDMRVMLGWETEKQYQARMVREKPDSKPEHWLYGDLFHCTDTNKEKVRCWNNANNRPFDSGWCEDLIHTILYGQWAGPLMMPGETINGETVRISRYGRVLSGQHQGTALVLADEWLAKSRAQDGNAASPKYPAWNGHEHPVIETVVITGLSEDERVLRTIDYVKPRTVGDMLYTTGLFRQNTPAERKEMTKMLASAIDLLWNRTNTKGYKTHPEVVGFLERHRRLLKCVEYIFVENNAKGTSKVFCRTCSWRSKSLGQESCPKCGGSLQRDMSARRLSKLRLGTGQCAALCYLMGSSGPKTDGDVYRNESPPSEKNLDWMYWDRACEFWSRLAGDEKFIPVRMALGLLIDSTPSNEENQGQGGRSDEKFAILAKAWEVWKDHPDTAGPPFDEADLGPGGSLCLEYSDIGPPSIRNGETVGGEKLPDGRIRLLDVADFLGIDCPEVIGYSRDGRRSTGAPEPPPPTGEEYERLKQEAHARRTKK